MERLTRQKLDHTADKALDSAILFRPHETHQPMPSASTSAIVIDSGHPVNLTPPAWPLLPVDGQVAGRTVTRRLSTAETARYTEWIANDRRLRRTVERMRALAEQAREITLAAQRASGSAP